MKTIGWLLGFMVLCIHCKYDTAFDEFGNYGEGSAFRNGQLWCGKLLVIPVDFNFCEPDTCIAVVIRRYDDEGIVRDYVTMSFTPLKIGKQTFNYFWPTYEKHLGQFTFGEFTSEGDVVVAGYNIFEQNPDNYIEITELDLKTGDIKGNFQAAVVRDSFWTPAGTIPDTIRFTNGVFSGKIFWK